MRYCVTVSYLGINYVGWQRQSNGISVQEVIEDTLSSILNQTIIIVSSGRTDALVHAKGQCFHFDCQTTYSSSYLMKAINGNLPSDIYVLDICKVKDDFHARFCVSRKHYYYLINVGPYDVFSKDLAFQCRYPLDLTYMQECAKLFLGRHDFGAFCGNSYTTHPNQVRRIDSIIFSKEGNFVKIAFVGKGFLRYMIRMIVGTLIEAARGRIDKAFIQYMLESRDKEACRWNAKAYGLYLEKVDYDDFEEYRIEEL
ncbi:MAG: tRNA pseudouridine(38-40) synthase TruA [Erysipelotrichaceae bacterium]|nr:tRNA pseudouridine(38-40) synthase TruA [Erysipelotrichaceae bacterium]